MHQSVLSYGEFVTYIRENVESVLADDRETEVVLSEIAKNNGVMSEIMTIQREGENAAPVFYMQKGKGKHGASPPHMGNK